LEFAFEQTGVPLRQIRVRVRPEAISGTPLLEQEFALREATASKELEVRIYSYIDRQPTERNNEYTLKLSVKCNQNNCAKLKQKMLSTLNFCVNSQTPRASKKKRHKPYFLPRVFTVALSHCRTAALSRCRPVALSHCRTIALNVSKLRAEEKPHLPSG